MHRPNSPDGAPLTSLEIRPEPPPPEREAIERALAERSAPARTLSRWWLEGIRENTGREPGETGWLREAPA